MLGVWDIRDEMLGMWDVWDVGCSGCGMFGMWVFRMWDVRDVGCLGCGMFGMCDVWNVGCSGWGVFGMFTGMWYVDLQNAVKIFVKLLRKLTQGCVFSINNRLIN